MERKVDRYCFGADIGGTTIKLGLFTPGGEVIKKWEIPTRKEDSGAYILKDIADSIMNEMDERKLTKDNIVGIGVGAPGPVDRDGVIYKAVNLGWGVLNLLQELNDLTGLLV